MEPTMICDLQLGQQVCGTNPVLDEWDLILIALAIDVAQASHVAFKFLGFVNSSIHITPFIGRWCEQAHALVAGGNH